MQPLSIIVCSWNNKPQTELLLHSIRQNSAEEHEICLHINEASDEFIEWAESTNRFNLSYSKENLGLAAGANMAAKNATHNFLYLIDDDMYVLPGWDKELSYVMEWYPEQSWINSTMIEPSGPSWATWSLRGHDFGRTPETFKEHDLLKTYHQFKDNLPPMRSTAMPCVLPKKWWDIVGGYDEEFGLAIGSEEGLAKRFWDVGFRTFINVPNSLVYHLQSTSTSRLPSYQNHMNHREATFLSKYGMTCTDFNNNYIKRGKPWLNMNS